MFATAGYANAKQRYAAIDLASKVEGASPHRLIAILFEEALTALDALAVGLAAAGARDRQGLIRRRSRVNNILLGLEAGLDHRQGGDLALRLQAVYREARRLVAEGSTNHDPKPIVQAREMIGEISGAWEKIA